MTKIKYTNYQLEITITRKRCLKGTDWKLAFDNSVGIIENIVAYSMYSLNYRLVTPVIHIVMYNVFWV